MDFKNKLGMGDYGEYLFSSGVPDGDRDIDDGTPGVCALNWVTAPWTGVIEDCITDRLGTSGSDSDEDHTNDGLLNPYSAPVLAPNGKIYAAHSFGMAIFVGDPSTDTSTFITVSPLLAAHGGALARNGCIYWPPGTSTQVVKLNPNTEEVTAFGSISGSHKWYGGVCDPTGRYVYGIPHNSTQVIKIDTDNDTISTFGSVGSGTTKWWGGCLGPNGKIYCAPYDDPSVLIIDTADDSTTEVGSISGSAKFISAVLGPNGIIYFIPHNSTNVRRIDPADDSMTTFGSISGSTKYSGGNLAANGFIYGSPSSATNVLKINTTNDTVTTPLTVTGNNRGFATTSSGDLYAAPVSKSTFLRVSPDATNQPATGTILSKYYNKS